MTTTWNYFVSLVFVDRHTTVPSSGLTRSVLKFLEECTD